MTSPLLEAVALACERDWRMLFEDLELRLASGDMLQISGPNGSGKTSLLRLLAIGICNLLLYFAFYIIMKVSGDG